MFGFFAVLLVLMTIVMRRQATLEMPSCSHLDALSFAPLSMPCGTSCCSCISGAEHGGRRRRLQTLSQTHPPPLQFCLKAAAATAADTPTAAAAATTSAWCPLAPAALLTCAAAVACCRGRRQSFSAAVLCCYFQTVSPKNFSAGTPRTSRSTSGASVTSKSLPGSRVS